MMLFGAALAVAAAWAMGKLLLDRAAGKLCREEAHVLAFVAGSVGLATGVAVCRWAGMPGLAALGGAALAAAWWRRGPGREPPAAWRGPWRVAFLAVLAVFGALYLLHAMMPEITPDHRYHRLAEVAAARYTGAPLWSPVELVYLFAFTFGRHSAAALVHLAYLAALALMVAAFCRRAGMPKAGAVAGVLVFASPLAGVSGSTASENVAVAAMLFAAFYLLYIRAFIPAAVAGAGAALTAAAWSGAAPAGMPGPAFLLAPVGLVALRWAAGRWALAAALAVAWLGIVPALPFVALAMGMAVNHSRYAAPALLAGHVLLSWPDVVNLYAPHAWRIRHVSLRAALRVRPEAEYLKERLPGYAAAQLVENAPAGALVYALPTLPRAYMRRTTVNAPELAEALHAPVLPALQPLRNVRLLWPPESVTAVRLWRPGPVNELRLLDGGREVARAPEWRLRAQPDSAAVQNAFDGSPVTRFDGEMVEVDMDSPRRVSGVVLECPGVASPSVEVKNDGRWRSVAVSVEQRSVPPPPMRRMAIHEFKRRGIHYVLVTDDDPAAPDLAAHAQVWGVKLAAESGDARLFRIE